MGSNVDYGGKEVALVDVVGVCANIQGQVNGLGTNTYFFSSVTKKKKKVAGIVSSSVIELCGRVFYSISGLKTFCPRLHHQPI